MATLPPEALDAETVGGLAAALGLGGSGSPLPDRTATVNALLDAAPPAVRERLLVEFLSLLQRPTFGVIITARTSASRCRCPRPGRRRPAVGEPADRDRAVPATVVASSVTSPNRSVTVCPLRISPSSHTGPGPTGWRQPAHPAASASKSRPGNSKATRAPATVAGPPLRTATVTTPCSRPSASLRASFSPPETVADRSAGCGLAGHRPGPSICLNAPLCHL